MAMGARQTGVWPPTKILSVVQVVETSSRPVRAETDGGTVFAKFVGNPEGPHVLAAEVLGIECAKLLGLPTFDYCVADFAAAEVAKVDLKKLEDTASLPAKPGAAFVTRLHEGDPWDGREESLRQIINVDDVAGLVVLDTWIRNRDRCSSGDTAQNVSNVFLGAGPGVPRGKFQLIRSPT